MAQDLDYEWEAYEKGWRGQSRQIKFTNEQLNIQIRHLTRKMKTEQESLRNEMSSREFIQRRKTGISQSPIKRPLQCSALI